VPFIQIIFSYPIRQQTSFVRPAISAYLFTMTLEFSSLVEDRTMNNICAGATFDRAVGHPHAARESAGRRTFADALLARLNTASIVYALWQERVRQRRALAALDHRMLKDIGVEPSDAYAEIHKPFWQA
jgi:uncharacterized protein YjiS (DUF1127 family)